MQDTPCPTGSLIALVPGAVILAPSRCKRWACDHCRKKKSKTLAARIMLTTARRFITLTIAPRPDQTPQEALDELNHSWRSLWKRIKREQGEAAKGYVKIIEVTRAGNPHLHVAADCGWIAQRKLSAIWNELTGSPIVDIRVVRTARGVARYLAKYLTKQSPALENRRKFGASRGFLPDAPKPVPEPGEIPLSWRWTSGPLDDLATNLVMAGYVPFGGGYLSPSAALLLGVSLLTAR